MSETTNNTFSQDITNDIFSKNTDRQYTINGIHFAANFGWSEYTYLHTYSETSYSKYLSAKTKSTTGYTGYAVYSLYARLMKFIAYNASRYIGSESITNNATTYFAFRSYSSDNFTTNFYVGWDTFQQSYKGELLCTFPKISFHMPATSFTSYDTYYKETRSYYLYDNATPAANLFSSSKYNYDLTSSTFSNTNFMNDFNSITRSKIQNYISGNYTKIGTIQYGMRGTPYGYFVKATNTNFYSTYISKQNTSYSFYTFLPTLTLQYLIGNDGYNGMHDAASFSYTDYDCTYMYHNLNI